MKEVLWIDRKDSEVVSGRRLSGRLFRDTILFVQSPRSGSSRKCSNLFHELGRFGVKGLVFYPDYYHGGNLPTTPLICFIVHFTNRVTDRVSFLSRDKRSS